MGILDLVQKVRFLVEFDLPDRLPLERERYREQIEAMLDVFAPRTSRIVDEAWRPAEEDDLAEAVGGTPLPHTAQARRTPLLEVAPRNQRPQLRIVK